MNKPKVRRFPALKLVEPEPSQEEAIKKLDLWFDHFTFWIWNNTGLPFVWDKVFPKVDPVTKRRGRATFILWVLGIYTALFGIASHRT